MTEAIDPQLLALFGLRHHLETFATWDQDAGSEGWEAWLPDPWREAFTGLDAEERARLTHLAVLADGLAAGVSKRAMRDAPQPLRSVFCGLTLENTPPSDYSWPVQPLALEESVIFPQAAERPSATSFKVALHDLWTAFKEDAEQLAQTHGYHAQLAPYLESLLLLLRRYTWCIPSINGNAAPDVSFYDHSRMAAALMVCLDSLKTPPVLHLDEAPQCTEDVALLVGGDLSGVQAFIYTITSRGAAGALRGRSFYLQLLTEAIVRYLLRQLELPFTNLIYQGGGSFYLLARPSDQQRLVELQRDISRLLLAHHHGELYLALSAVSLQGRDFFAGRIAQRWQALAEQQQVVKERRFAELGAELVQLFTPQGEGGDETRECQVCGQEHPDIAVDAESETRKCAPCRAYEDLGKRLRRANYLWLEIGEIAPPTEVREMSGGWEAMLRTLGLHAGLNSDIRDLPPLQETAHYRTLLALNDGALSNLAPGPRTAVGRRFLVNVTPTLSRADIDAVGEKIDEPLYPDTVKPFSVLEKQAHGIQRLGVLRMDVDNLGRLFAEGFGDAASLSRVAALSFTMSLYFEGWVEVLAHAHNAAAQATRGDVLYSIYSGGDDLFFVGAWDAVVELARDIRRDLKRFAAGHADVHASAGIVLVGGKYPLYQAAADAGEAEHEAKAYPGKDAVTFLGRTLPWARFGLEAECAANMETVHGLRHHLEWLVLPQEEGGLGAPASLLQHLIRLQIAYETALEARRQTGTAVNREGEVQGVWGPWMWRGYYTLKRMARRMKETGAYIEALAEQLHEEDFRSISWIGLAARWAGLWMRSE
ncbi:MAG: type III-A CRISPR-associated protein Cas10/Csm1 [Anaerolineae bacterium]